MITEGTAKFLYTSSLSYNYQIKITYCMYIDAKTKKHTPPSLSKILNTPQIPRIPPVKCMMLNNSRITLKNILLTNLQLRKQQTGGAILKKTKIM